VFVCVLNERVGAVAACEIGDVGSRYSPRIVQFFAGVSPASNAFNHDLRQPAHTSLHFYLAAKRFMPCIDEVLVAACESSLNKDTCATSSSD
jgi:hypothetical protein